MTFAGIALYSAVVALPPPAPVAALAPPRYVDSVWCMDALAFCAALPERSVDMILCDPPYGTTACSWDEVIPFEPMWRAFKRVIKSRGAIVMTASQPFTSRLVMSNLAWFKHEVIWNKKLPGNFLLAKVQPLKVHENVLVFGQSSYYCPQMRKGINRTKGGGKSNLWQLSKTTATNDTYYPTSIIEFGNTDRFVIHPTQKPVDLFAYLIRTYTRPGDLVCDPTCGSGTTAIAARNTGRRYVVNDYDPHWYGVTCERLALPYTLPLPLDAPAAPVAAVQEALL